MTHAPELTDAEIEDLIGELRARTVRLQGGATSEAGWSIVAVSTGELVRTDRDGPAEQVVFCCADDARQALRTYGRRIVVRLRPA